MSRADAVTLLERARALVHSESHRDASDRSDESGLEDAASVALSASVAALGDGEDPPQALLKALTDAYVGGGQGPVLRTTFGRWTTASGFAYENRGGVAVALDASGRVVAAADTHAPATVTRHQSAGARGVRRTHTHGWARVDGAWTCVQDHNAAGAAPGTGCGQTWDEADQP